MNSNLREKIIDAIIGLSKNKLERRELIELSKMTHDKLVRKLISVAYSIKTPVNKYLNKNCDDSCYYHCTKGGQQKPNCESIKSNLSIEKATVQDIVVGNVLYSLNTEGDFEMIKIKDVLDLNDPWKSFLSGDGCRDGLMFGDYYVIKNGYRI